jgi:hypothetical protein
MPTASIGPMWRPTPPDYSSCTPGTSHNEHHPITRCRRSGSEADRWWWFAGTTPSLSMDDYPFQKSLMALWGDNYQPGPSPKGDVRSGGFAHLVDMFGGLTGPMPPGYVFISYRATHDRQFVQDQVRPVLALGGYPSWDYRMSEHLINAGLAERLRQRLESAAALLVVATEAWSSDWTALLGPWV